MERSDTLMDNHETGSFSTAFHQVVDAIETDVRRGRNVLLIASSLGESHLMRDVLRNRGAVMGVSLAKNWTDFTREFNDESCHVVVIPAVIAMTGMAPPPRFDTMYICSAPEEKNDLIQLQARIARMKPAEFKDRVLKFVVCVDTSHHNTEDFNARRMAKAERIARHFNGVVPESTEILQVGTWL